MGEGLAASVREKLSSNDNEGSVVRRQAWLSCRDGARDTRKGWKNQVCACRYLRWPTPVCGCPELEAASESSSLTTLDGLFCRGFV